jgi:hypothetical protein
MKLTDRELLADGIRYRIKQAKQLIDTLQGQLQNLVSGKKTAHKSKPQQKKKKRKAPANKGVAWTPERRRKFEERKAARQNSQGEQPASAEETPEVDTRTTEELGRSARQ